MRRVVELLHLGEQLGRERVAQQLLRFLQLPRETAVERVRLLELLLERGRGLLELLDLVGERALVLRDGLRLLRRVVAHVALLVAGAVRRARRRFLRRVALRPIARRVARPLLKRLLRGGRLLRLADGRVHRRARDGAALFHRRNLQ